MTPELSDDELDQAIREALMQSWPAHIVDEAEPTAMHRDIARHFYALGLAAKQREPHCGGYLWPMYWKL